MLFRSTNDKVGDQLRGKNVPMLQALPAFSNASSSPSSDPAKALWITPVAETNARDPPKKRAREDEEEPRTKRRKVSTEQPKRERAKRAVVRRRG